MCRHILVNSEIRFCDKTVGCQILKHQKMMLNDSYDLHAWLPWTVLYSEWRHRLFHFESSSYFCGCDSFGFIVKHQKTKTKCCDGPWIFLEGFSFEVTMETLSLVSLPKNVLFAVKVRPGWNIILTWRHWGLNPGPEERSSGCWSLRYGPGPDVCEIIRCMILWWSSRPQLWAN